MPLSSTNKIELPAIVFLDVDGVLNSEAYRTVHGRESVDPAACERVNRLLELTGAKLVVSSSWRKDADCRQKLVAAGLSDAFADPWRTSRFLPREAMADPRRARASEIDAYVETHRIRSYVILDDDPGLFPRQARKAVLTDDAKGFTDTALERAIVLLVRGRICNEQGSEAPAPVPSPFG